MSSFQSLLGPVVRLNHFFDRAARCRRSVHVDRCSDLLLFQHIPASLNHRIKAYVDRARRLCLERKTSQHRLIITLSKIRIITSNGSRIAVLGSFIFKNRTYVVIRHSGVLDVFNLRSQTQEILSKLKARLCYVGPPSWYDNRVGAGRS